MVQLRKKQKRMLKRIVIASILTTFLAICSAFDLLPVDGSIEKYVLFVCYLVPYLIIGYDVLRKAAKGIANGQALDENFLMAIATIGAMALGVTYTGDYDEAVACVDAFKTPPCFTIFAPPLEDSAFCRCSCTTPGKRAHGFIALLSLQTYKRKETYETLQHTCLAVIRSRTGI